MVLVFRIWLGEDRSFPESIRYIHGHLAAIGQVIKGHHSPSWSMAQAYFDGDEAGFYQCVLTIPMLQAHSFRDNRISPTSVVNLSEEKKTVDTNTKDA